MMRKTRTPQEGCGTSRAEGWGQEASGRVLLCAARIARFTSNAWLAALLVALVSALGLAHPAHAQDPSLGGTPVANSKSFPNAPGGMFGKINKNIDNSKNININKNIDASKNININKSIEINMTLRKKMLAKLGMGEELADFMGLSTMTREFMETEAGFNVMRANQANIRNNSPELYMAFLDSVLWWGRRLPG